MAVASAEGPAPASVAKDVAKDCNAYGISALSDAKANQDSACNFTGARWSTDVNVHLKWCNTGNITNQYLQGEIAVRKKMLETCATSQMLFRGIEKIEAFVDPTGKKGYNGSYTDVKCSGNRKLIFWALTFFRCGSSKYKCEQGSMSAERWDDRTLRCGAAEDANTDTDGRCTGWCL